MLLGGAPNPQDIAAAITRLRGGTVAPAPEEPMQPSIDAQQQREAIQAATGGRKIADYRKALERGGFHWWPPAALARLHRSPQAQGLWRNNYLHAALTTTDVLSWFATPEDLWNWIERRHRAKKHPRAPKKRR